MQWHAARTLALNFLLKTIEVPNPVDRLVGLVVKASASRAEGPGFEPRLRRDIFGVESYLWLQAPGVIGSTLGLVGPVSVYCNFYLSVAARKIV